MLAIFAMMLFASFVTSASAEEGALTQRSDIEEKYKWRVEDIYADLTAWEADFTYINANLNKLTEYKGKLGESAETLLDYFKTSEGLEKKIDNMFVYAYLKLDEDNRASAYQELGGRIAALSSEFSQAVSYFNPEILALGQDKINSLLDSNKELAVYRFRFKDMFRQNAHILPAEQEELLALIQPVASTAREVFNMITDADMTYGSVYDEDSNLVELSRQRYSAMLESSDRRVRRDASDTYNAAYKKRINSLAATLGGSVKKDFFYSKARKYNSCLEASLDNYNIPTSVFDNLIDAVNANLAPLHKWASLRKKLLDIDTLYTYDMWVPVLPDLKKEYTYEQAQEMLMEGLKPMGKAYLSELSKGLKGGWIDVYETEGKGSGAYSWGTYTTHPYILLNFNGQLEDVFTLAHEMGHAMHSVYTHRSEPYAYGNNSLFVAEVASTLNESVMLKYMLDKTTDREEKMSLLNYYINQIIGTFYTQVMFSEFERAIHDHVQDGGAFSADYFRKTYRAIYQKYWGPEMVIGEDKDLGGMRISHFYRQFYVYQYATSYAAAQKIAQRILDGEKGAIDGYAKFLSTGTSMFPIDILKEAGVDMTTPGPVNATITRFAELVDEMERLINEK